MPCFKFSKLVCGFSCLLVVGVILIILAFVLPIFIEKAISQKAKEHALMNNENYNLWGIIPGKSQVSLHRDFYLYNLTNPDDFLYDDAKPEFVEVGPYTYDEHQNYTNVNYKTPPNSTNELIQYQFWQYFIHTGGNPEERVNSMNRGSLGVWHQAKNAETHKMALQVFSSLILDLETELMTVSLSQGLQNFLKK